MSYSSYPSNGARRPAPASSASNPFEQEAERQPTEHERIIGQILDVQQESKSSTQRSLALLYQTEEIGVATAENLIEQGEKLDRIEGTVKKIDVDLKESQKHINGLKSVFGGVTNWWQARKEKKLPKEETVAPVESGLKGAMKKSTEQSYSTPSRATTAGSATREPNRTGGTSVQSVIDQYEEDIEQDLSQMGDLTERLKYMAVAMGEEMEKQNTQIDRITDRVGKTEATVTDKNKQMNKILKK